MGNMYKHTCGKHIWGKIYGKECYSCTAIAMESMRKNDAMFEAS